MIKVLANTCLSVLIVLGSGCGHDNPVDETDDLLELTSIQIGDVSLVQTAVVEDVPVDKAIVVFFAIPIDTEMDIPIQLMDGSDLVVLSRRFSNSNTTISLTLSEDLKYRSTYLLKIGEVLGVGGEKFIGAEFEFETQNPKLEITSATINSQDLLKNSSVRNVGPNIQIEINFSGKINPSEIEDNFSLISPGSTAEQLTFSVTNNEQTLVVNNNQSLGSLEKYELTIRSNISTDDYDFDGFQKDFITKLDSTFKFEEISDEELLTKVQAETFRYFWDFGHPTSGLARERNTSGDLVTTGGSGFGLMAIVVGIERGFITRTEGIDRLKNIVQFLGSNADRFHGAWSHWLNGRTGNTVPFSTRDDGGDLVETAFLVEGLLTVRQYLNATDPEESELIEEITQLWENVEWDWYTQGGQNVLYWHWSPNFGWELNHQISGWNEALMVYVLAAASPTHSVDREVYDEGWARSGGIINGAEFYNTKLPLGSGRGGPLFFSHYSFLGLDPRKLRDSYANYWEQNTNHSLINYAYCVDNPKNFVGYSTASWGLTASDSHEGYSAHAPNNDLGVITPTAAISSIPYTPDKSMKAIRHFYYILGDRLWGEYGFYDAFNSTEGWYANSYLAIDQGPIICMIENHRTGLLWDLFMSAPEVQNGLQKLGITYE